MQHTEHTQLSQHSIPQQAQRPAGSTTLRRVWQDNPAPPPNRVASPQIAPQPKQTREHPLNSKIPRAQKKHSTKRQTTSLTVWPKPGVKAALQRIADREGLSLSAICAAFLEKAIQNDVYTQHEAVLEPLIEQAIRKHMRQISTRLAMLLVRVAFDAGQTRSLVTNILARQPGVTPSVLTTIVDGSSKTAKGNITRRTPQLEHLIAEVEKWLATDEGEQKNE